MKYSLLIKDMTTEYLDALEFDSKNSSKGKWTGMENELANGVLHPVADLKFLPYLILAQVIYGPLPAELLDDLVSLKPLRETVFQKVIAGGISRSWISRYLPLASNRLLWEYKSRWAAFNASARNHATTIALQPIVNEEGTTVETRAKVPILDMDDSTESGEISKEELLQTLDEILWANLDVTMGGLAWTLVFLAANQSAQSKLRGEIFSMMRPFSKSNDSHKRENSPSLESTFDEYLCSASSTYLNACILEAARLRPVAAFSVPQAAPSPRILSSYSIPAGTSFIVDSYALNVENTVWGPDRKE